MPGSLIGPAIAIGGAILGKKSAKKSERAQLKALRVSSAEQAALSTEALEVRDRLKRIQIKQQATIAVSRQRTQSQRARIGGVGGSFAKVRSGATEIQAQVKLQTEALEANFELAEKQIAVTLAAAQRGAVTGAAQASSVANIALTGQIGQITQTAFQNPAIVSAVSNFFSPTGQQLGGPIPPLGQGPGA